MKKYIKIIGAFAVLSIAIMVGTVVALKNIDVNSFKNEITAELKKATGRDVKIAGDLGLSVSFSPKLRVEDVTFANAPWGSEPEMVTLGLLEAKVSLLALISGEININYLIISDMDLLLETDAKGHANWDFQTKNKSTINQKESPTSKEQLPTVRDIRLRNVRVTYIDGVQKSKFSVAIPHMNLSSKSGNDPVRVNVNAELNSVPLDVVATIGSFNQFSNIDEMPFPINVAISSSGILAKIDGNMHIPKTGLKIGLDANLSATDMESLGKMAETQLPPFSKIEFSARLDGDAINYKISKINAVLGHSDISGDASISIADKRPAIKANLKSILMDISEITSADKKNETETSDKLFSSNPISFSGLKSVDIDLAYNADAVKVDVLKLKKLSTKVTLKNGKLAINPFNVSVGDGYLRAQINVDGTAAKPAIVTKISARSIDAGRLLSEFEFGNYLTLKTDFEADLKGAGVSVHDIMSGLGGTLRFVGTNGRLNDAVISTISTGIMDVLPWVSRADSNVINCVAVDIPIQSGIAVANKMFMDTNGMTIIGKGKADLGTEMLDLVFSPRAKNVSLGSFAVPLALSGKFSNPDFGINPEGVVLGTIDNVGNIVGDGAGALGGLLGTTLGMRGDSPPPSDYDPCIKFLSNKKNAPKAVTNDPTNNEAAPKNNPTTAVKDLTNSIEKSIGGAIKGIFGNK